VKGRKLLSALLLSAGKREQLFDACKKNARAEGKKVKFSFCLSRSVRESVAHLPREEDQEAEDEREKGQPEPRLQRGAGL